MNSDSELENYSDYTVESKTNQYTEHTKKKKKSTLGLLPHTEST